MAATTAPTPQGLKAAGKKLWTETLDMFELRQDELVVLRSACFEVDLIERMEKELRDEDLTVTGSMGQLVPHPLVSELRQHRATLSTILRGMKLPDEAASPGNQQREAAQKRWATHGQAS